MGKYDVTVKAGPSYSSQREETRETLIEIMRAVPEAGPFITDKILELMDFRGADQIAKRAKMLLPQHIQEAEAKEDAKDMPPEMQEIMAQGEQIINGLKQQVKELQDEQAPEMAKVKLEERRVDLEEQQFQLEAASKQMEVLKEQQGPQEEAPKESEVRKDHIEMKRLDLEEMKLNSEEKEFVEEISGPDIMGAMEQLGQIMGQVVEAQQKVMEIQATDVEIVRDAEGKIIRATRNTQPVETE